MKKDSSGVKVAKVRVCVAMLTVVLGFGACGPKADEVSDVSSEPSLSTEADAPTSESTEMLDPSKSEGMESSDDVKSSEVMEEPAETAEPVVEETVITAESSEAYINELMEKYKNMPGKEYIPVAYLAANYDYFAAGEMDAYKDIYSLSDETVSDDFNRFVQSYMEIIRSIANHNAGVDVEIICPYDDTVKLAELVMNESDNATAKEFDSMIDAYNKGKSKSSDNLFNTSVSVFFDKENLTSGRHFCFNIGYCVSIGTIGENVFDTMQQ